MDKDENRKEAGHSDEVRIICERFCKYYPNSSMGWRVVSLLESLKMLEEQESDFQSQRSSNYVRLEEEVDELDKIMHSCRDDDGCGNSLNDSTEILDSAKKELAAKLRSIVLLKRQLDEVPTQAELEQYELRSSELNTQIQKKHQQTRKNYDTYNALMEIKELMQKETSLLNSITVQFQNAITSADGRIKLIDSLEGILNGIEKKLEKVQMTQQSEQRLCDNLKENYAAAVSEQRQISSCLKIFQEECTRNERLRAQIEHKPST
ncbi:hypothetical protein ACJIZ3_004964 [Penstemon smallii]|uniref:CCDC93 coiled-coil domain-containing protein n=1 Tax=Penstemon smallii TaxID=265156 RepID=A0ABD3S3J5_9LAMI